MIHCWGAPLGAPLPLGAPFPLGAPLPLGAPPGAPPVAPIGCCIGCPLDPPPIVRGLAKKVWIPKLTKALEIGPGIFLEIALEA